MEEHDRYREWSGAYVLGALDADERRRFEQHLAACEACRREVADLAPLPAFLARIESPEALTVPDSVLEEAQLRIASERSDLVRSRRRWRWVAVAAVVLAAVLVGAVQLLGTETPQATPLAVESSAATSAQITVTSRQWGTAIDLRVQDLPLHDTYVAWAVDQEGTWQQVATWGPTPAKGAVVSGASSFATPDLAKVVVTSEDRSETIVTGWPSG